MSDRADSQPGDGQEVHAGRRDFLKAAGIAGAAAAAASAAATGTAEAQEFPPDEPTRYELTPHIERFYLLNRL